MAAWGASSFLSGRPICSYCHLSSACVHTSRNICICIRIFIMYLYLYLYLHCLVVGPFVPIAMFPLLLLLQTETFVLVSAFVLFCISIYIWICLRICISLWLAHLFLLSSFLCMWSKFHTNIKQMIFKQYRIVRYKYDTFMMQMCYKCDTIIKQI